jgi:excisionase family DNA binding protein
MADVDYATWFTKQQAADAIGVTTKTVEQLAKDRRLEQGFWRRPTGGPLLAVYNPDDVSRIALERHQAPAPFVLPAMPASTGNGNGRRHVDAPNQALTVPSSAAAGDDLVAQFLHGLRSALTPPPASESSEKLFLTVDQAAELLNWTPRDLRRAIRTGEISARNKERRDWRTWRIRRRDLEQL